jgi:serine/threonine-protein kinase
MSQARGPGPEAQSLESARRIDQVCLRFEAAWRAAPGDVRIEAFLDPTPEPERSALLRELVILELDLRRARGESPSEREYLERCPRHGDLIHALFFDPDRDTTAWVPGGGTDPTATGSNTGLRAPTAATEPSGRPLRFGDYELLEEIDRGGMGVIFTARQLRLNRVVAVKMIRAGLLASRADVRRFLAEAEVAAGLDHPHIVPIYEVGDCQGQPYFSMKLIPGGSLARHRARLAGSPRAIATLMATVARAVHHAHERGILHRDLKPSNILLDAAGQPHVGDFGLARWLEGDRGMTQSGAILGTPSYMPPEQAAGRSEDMTPASDVYSLGAILYELLAGRPPFQADSAMDTLLQVLEQDPVRPRSLDPGIDPGLEAICLKCLEKEPTRRYGSAGALADDLERYLRDEALEACRDALGTRPRRWARREPALACHLGALALYGLLLGLMYALRGEIGGARQLGVLAVLLLWALASLALQSLMRRDRRADGVRLAWAVIDLVALTGVLWFERAWPSSQVACYLLLIAGSGLWFRERLVWLTTALGVIAYLSLVVATRARGLPWADQQRPDIVVAALVVAGLVVGYQVKRLRTLSRSLDLRRP